MNDHQSSSPDTSGLLPCPFCNRELEHDAGISATFHPEIPYEEYCPLKGFLFASDRKDIIAAWNTRARSSAATAAPIDLTNHHNALLCPYCNPKSLQFADAAQPSWLPDVLFLLDRLEEFDPGDDEPEREFHGHVAPAIARLRSAISSTDGGSK